MKVESVVKATVRRVEPHGVYLSHGDEEILVLIPELAWNPVLSPGDRFFAGDELEVKILRYVAEDGRYVGSVRKASSELSPYARLAEASPETRFRARLQSVLGDVASVELVDLPVLGHLPAEQLPAEIRIGALVQVRLKTIDVENARATFELLT